MSTRRLGTSAFFDEIEVGTVVDHVQSRTVFASEMAMTSALFHHHNPLYLDVDRAREAGHPDLVANPLLLFNLVLGITVRELTEEAGPFLGAERVEFLRPVYPGTSVRARSTVLAKRVSASRPGWGIVTWNTVGWAPEPVGDFLRYDRSNLVPFSPSSGLGS